jgi:hypothetical protein
MNKLLFIPLILLAATCACSDNIGSRIDGQWQLNTIESGDTIFQVDTVFYNFMKSHVFAYIYMASPDAAPAYYGYIDELTDDRILINIDRNHFEALKNVSQSEWDTPQRIFDIREITSRRLTLFDQAKNRTYFFKKH